jgi:putative transposase
MSETYKSNRNVFYSCRYKVVLCPRISAKSVRAGGRNALIRDHQAGLPGALGRDRRIGSHTAIWLHRLVKLIQGRSLRLLSQEFPVLKRKLQIYGRIRIFVRPREERRSQ